MIAIVSSNARERMAFGAMCDIQGWPAIECESLRTFRRTLQQLSPAIVLTRHKLSDGYADDVTKLMLRDSSRNPANVIVLFDAGASPAIEARQITLGATCVLRDPIRTEVLLAYLARYVAEPARQQAAGNRAARDAEFDFAGARVHPMDRKIETARRATHVTPRELELIRLLGEACGEVVTYQTLYSDMLGRRFRGDTSNMRVLLGRLDRSFGTLHISLRDFVEVIPKTGYRYIENPGRTWPGNFTR